MSDPVSGPGPVVGADLSAASSENARRGAREVKPSTAVVHVGPAKTNACGLPPESRAGDTTFTAQMMGQTGRKRGLKGGAPVLDEAKAAYLGTEWSGPSDRRLAAGKMTKTDI